MAARFQVSVDANDPRALAAFWAVALPGYVEQPPPAGFASWEAFAEQVGLPPEEVDRISALVDPEGTGPRLLFQRVPERKASKNRFHLDVDASAGREDFDVVREHAERLVQAGATLVEERQDQLSRWIVLLDLEGNEFCVQ